LKVFGGLNSIFITQFYALYFKFKNVEKVAISFLFKRIEKSKNCVIPKERQLHIIVVFAV